MSNRFFDFSTNPYRFVARTKARAEEVNARLDEVSYGFERVQGEVGGLNTALDGKAPLVSPVFTGVPRVPTATAGASGSQAASLDYVNATAFSTSLPGQANAAGLELVTDGANAGWGLTAPGAISILNFISQ